MPEHTPSDNLQSSSPRLHHKHNIAHRLPAISASFLCLFLILRHSDAAVAYMKQGLSLCAETVIPSLFPFMVISELLVFSGGGELLGRLFEKPFQRLFGISGAGVCAVIMGWICGFPIGTKTAVTLCKQGVIREDELSDLICYCNIPSAAFLINGVGVSLFGNRRFGLLLYLLCILSSLLTAIILHRLHPRPKASAPLIRMGSSSSFTLIQSITSAATAMLYVCAYVLFFSALSGTLGELLQHYGIGQSVIAFISGFFELSGGIMQASALTDPNTARQIVTFLCGWSGISVHLQIFSLCTGLPAGQRVRVIPYLICKILQGVFCTVLGGVLLRCFPAAHPILSAQPALPVISSPFSIYFWCIFNLSLILLICAAVGIRRSKR